MADHHVNTLQIVFFAAFVVATIIANVYWYRAKFFLQARGFPVSLFTRHFQDFRHLAEVRKTETDSAQRHYATLLRSRIKLWLIISLILFAAFFISSIATMPATAR